LVATKSMTSAGRRWRGAGQRVHTALFEFLDPVFLVVGGELPFAGDEVKAVEIGMPSGFSMVSARPGVPRGPALTTADAQPLNRREGLSWSWWRRPRM
jgi:hypothetical protein